VTTEEIGNHVEDMAQELLELAELKRTGLDEIALP